MAEGASAPSPPGPWHVAVAGIGTTGFVMLPPNPLDGSSWLYQAAHFSTWFRTLAVDLPGYGHSPRLAGPVTMPELAAAAWAAVDGADVERAILAGVSIGSGLALHMARLRPDRTEALILSGCSYSPTKPFARRRIDCYTSEGIGYRPAHLRDGHAPAFRESAIGRYLDRVATDRAHLVDVESMVRLYEAHGAPDPDDLFDVSRPTLIVTGELDYAHPGALALHERIRGSELVVLDGAGHACNVEQPERWDDAALGFLRRRTEVFAD
jgi:3-oxoadipate enol-lactonase